MDLPGPGLSYPQLLYALGATAFVSLLIGVFIGVVAGCDDEDALED